MTLLTKLGLSVLGVGSVSAGGYGVYESIRPKTIADQLKWEGFTLGDVVGDFDDNETSGLWQKLYEKYNDNSNDKKFKEKENDVTGITDRSKLKSYCDKVFKLSKNDQDNLNKAKFWCIKESEKLRS